MDLAYLVIVYQMASECCPCFEKISASLLEHKHEDKIDYFFFSDFFSLNSLCILAHENSKFKLFFHLEFERIVTKFENYIGNHFSDLLLNKVLN